MRSEYYCDIGDITLGIGVGMMISAGVFTSNDFTIPYLFIGFGVAVVGWFVGIFGNRKVIRS